MAKSGRFLAASCTPTTFSTALPAIATTTSPAKASLIPSVSVAGFKRRDEPVAHECRCDTGAAEHDDRRRERSSARAPRLPSSATLRRPGSVRKNNASSTPAQMKLSVRSCAAAGVWNACASVGSDRIAAASDGQRRDHTCSRRVERLRAVAQATGNECEPEHEDRRSRSPSRRARPARRRSSPWCNANSAMNSSGRFPSARLDRAGGRRAHAAAELLRRATDEAGESAIASAASTKVSTGVASAKCAMAAAATRSAAAIASSIDVSPESRPYHRPHERRRAAGGDAPLSCPGRRRHDCVRR